MGTVLIPRQLIGQILITKQGWCCSIFLTRTMTEHASCLTYPLVLTYPLMSSGQTVSEFAHIVGIIGHALEDRSGQVRHTSCNGSLPTPSYSRLLLC